MKWFKRLISLWNDGPGLTTTQAPDLVTPPVPVLRPAPSEPVVGLNEEWASPHFKWTELQCKGACQTCPHAADAGGPVRFVDAVSIQMLERFRVEAGVPVTLNSAARCPIHNAREGGKPLSKHRSSRTMSSTAFDVRIGTMTKSEIIALAEKIGFNGIGVNYRTFVHIDKRQTRARW